jgi:hypothetical protein
MSVAQALAIAAASWMLVVDVDQVAARAAPLVARAEAEARWMIDTAGVRMSRADPCMEIPQLDA